MTREAILGECGRCQNVHVTTELGIVEFVPGVYIHVCKHCIGEDEKYAQAQNAIPFNVLRFPWFEKDLETSAVDGCVTVHMECQGFIERRSIQGDTDLDVGDVVCLKSGGPPMTIEEVCSAVAVSVLWFHNGEARRAILPSCVLQKCAPSS